MTMDEDPLPTLDEAIHLLADLQDLFIAGQGEILPEAIKVSDSRIVDDFRVVREPDCVAHKSVPAQRVLPRLLQIKNSSTIQLLQLVQHVELLDFAVRQASRCK